MMDLETYYSSLSRRTRLSIATITLLVHMAALLYLLQYLEYSPMTHMFNLPQDQTEQEAKKHLEDNSMILSQSPYDQGAPVIFADEPEPHETPVEQPPMPPASQEETSEPLQQAMVQEQPHVQEQAAQTEPLPQRETSLLQESQAAAPEEKQAVSQEIEPRTITETTQQEALNKTEQQPRRRRRRRRAEGEPRVTMAQLAKGFLKSMEQERGLTEVHEKDMHNLAQHIYATKVWNHFKSVINAERIRPNNQKYLNVYTTITIVLGQKGELLGFKFQHYPSDSEREVCELEGLFAHALKRSGLFPPIPKQFDVDSITLHASLSVQLPPGQTIILTINTRY